MPLSVVCPSCGARLRAPDHAVGRTVKCPQCKAPMAIPHASGPSSAFAFESASPSATDYYEEEGNPFDDEAPEEPPSEIDPADAPKKGRRSASKKKPKAGGFNPFDEEAPDDEPAAADPTKKRRYRKDGDYNPFGDVPVEEMPDPVGEGFDFGIEAPPPTPTSEFDFGHPSNDDDPRRR